MQYRSLGKTKIEITPIIFGGWQAGKSGWTNIDDAQTIAAHQAAFDSGITTFDTAEAYGEGYSERILAQASAANGIRSSLRRKSLPIT